eukprot:CAMPEP_0170265184 /NCGR_PEP_ID=MMETSP0116_2-20130129/32497_1 /TAXON_ID=400756 /ORGANISM="Durinskia baltica, Strain CSIRO CS-38" /LENGTH=187 /DNA_ID=CAMNT_0010516297 /DNA_START=56 /DNA_END=616 /DNA_ORIENTATION=+
MPPARSRLASRPSTHVSVLDVPVDPIEDVQSTVGAHSPHEAEVRFSTSRMRCSSKSWGTHDRDAFQPDRRGPHELGQVPLMRSEHAKDCDGRQDVQLVGEVVLFSVVGRRDRRLVPHDVNKVEGADDEETLQDAVVQRNERPEEVDISQEEDQNIQLLRPARNAHAVFVVVQLVQQEHDARNMQHIA